MLSAVSAISMVRPAPSQHRPKRSHPTKPTQQVSLWADLLDDLDQGEPAISTTASEMAADVPASLRGAVNNELARRGCRFRIES